jgi:anti-sigma B factor antagonist
MKPENSLAAAAPDSAGTHVGAAHMRGAKALKLSLEAARLGSTVVLHCEGQVIARSEAKTLSTLIAEVLPSSGRMVVDLGGVVSIESHALGELVLIHMWADAAGFALTFANPSDSVRGLFESTRLDSIFDVHASVDDALAAMQPEEVHLA